MVMSERLPVTLPAFVAAKLNVKPWLCPGVRLNGGVKPVMLNPVPLTVA